MNGKRKCKKLFIALLAIIFAVGAYALCINFYIIGSAQKQILEESRLGDGFQADCVLVLGCGVKPDGTPSHMLVERVKAGSSVYEKTKAGYLLLSGDKSGESYNEPAVMKSLALENGIEEKDIVTDNIGYSTYESIYNAKTVYHVQKLIIITQPYHLPRALYIARSLGMEAYGYEAYLPLYPKQIIWSAREVAARNKDFLKCALDEF